MGGWAPPNPAVWKMPPHLWPESRIAELRVRLRGRGSWFPSRRRRAHVAVLELIRWHEATLWPEPSSTLVEKTNQFQVFASYMHTPIAEGVTPVMPPSDSSC